MLQDIFSEVQLVAVSALLYLAAHRAARIVLFPRIDEKKRLVLSRSDQFEVSQKIPSILNGCITGMFAFWLVFVDRAFEDDIFRAYPSSLNLFFANMIGYTLYDLSIMAQQTDIPKDMWAHHLLGLFGCLGMMYFKEAAFMPVVFGITELTVIPHNLLWLVRRFGEKNSPSYKAALFGRAASFVLFRLPMLPFAIWYSVNHQGPVPAGATPWSSYLQKWQQVHPIVMYGTAINVVVFGLLNTGWSIAVVYLAIAHARRPTKTEGSVRLSKDHLS